MSSNSPIGDIFTNAQKNTAPAALGVLMEAAKSKTLSPEMRSVVAKEFEAMFMSQMLGSMFGEGEEGDSLFGGGEGDDVFKGMMIEQYATQIAKSGGIGIASYVEKELLRMQEISTPQASPLSRLEVNHEPDSQ